jgi:hypothetical protein
MSAITPLPPHDRTPPPAAHENDVLDRLAHAVSATPAPAAALDPWRWTVRQHLVGVRDLLTAETSAGIDGWLVARDATARRRCHALLARISRLGPQVLESSDLAGVRRELARLVVDVRHHRQRLHDLAYDEVALELGGSD